MSLIIRERREEKYFYAFNNNPLGSMSAIILLLFASLSVAAVFLGAFLWSVKSGQYDDDVSPPMRMLFDNKPTTDQKKS